MKLVSTVIEIPAGAESDSGTDYSEEISFLSGLTPLTADQLKNPRVGYPVIVEDGESVKGVSTRIGKAARRMGIHVISPTSKAKTERVPQVGVNLAKFSATTADGEKCVTLRIFTVEPATIAAK